LARTERLVKRGFARYLDADRSAWKYTLFGAVFVAVRATLRQYRQSFGNRMRRTIRRPGQAGYVGSARSPAAAPSVAILNKIQNVFWIVILLGIVLSLTGGLAGKNRNQSLLRVAVNGIGLLGVGATFVAKVFVTRLAAPRRRRFAPELSTELNARRGRKIVSARSGHGSTCPLSAASADRSRNTPILRYLS
jgi:hypothetical protein